jgi:hypothetical protein
MILQTEVTDSQIVLSLSIVLIFTFSLFRVFNHFNKAENDKEECIIDTDQASRHIGDKKKETTFKGGNSGDSQTFQNKTVHQLEEINAKQAEEKENIDRHDNNKKFLSSADRTNIKRYDIMKKDEVPSKDEVDNSRKVVTQPKDSVSEWRCVCETGFLPPGLLKSFGGMEAMVRMSTGQCYHKT